MLIKEGFLIIFDWKSGYASIKNQEGDFIGVGGDRKIYICPPVQEKPSKEALKIFEQMSKLIAKLSGLDNIKPVELMGKSKIAYRFI